MKLYTEQQLREAIEMAREGIRSKDSIIDTLNFMKPPIELTSDSLCINCDESESTHNICMNCIIKIGKENIQLPSNEEVEEQSWGYREVTKYMKIPPNEDWSNGAKWMRDKIQGGNK